MTETHIDLSDFVRKPAAVLDLAGACKFLEMSRSELLALIPQAIFEIKGRIDLARKALGGEEYFDLTRNVHTIKSVAASIGAVSVSLAARDVEKAALAKEACTAGMSTLEEEFVRLSDEAKKL